MDQFNLTDIEQRVCDIAAVQLNLKRAQIHPSSRLIEDLRCDSLDMIELIMELEDAFGITIPTTPPHSVYKSVFARRQFRLRDAAEIVYLQRGTGKPDRRAKRPKVDNPPMVESIPFSQLSGRWSGLSAEIPTLYERLEDGGRYPMVRRRSDGMRCVLVPADLVELGSNGVEAQPDERPVHLATVDPFLIDVEPVSTTAFCRFLNSIHPTEGQLNDWFVLSADDDRQAQMPIHQADGEWRPVAGAESLPMVLVSWFGANAYSLWANNADWSDYHTMEGFLPTEAQWEYAARGPVSQPFPWGEAADESLMCCARHESAAEYSTATTLPMADVHARLGMSPFGLHHMAGNVWQWCRDWYDRDFYRRPEATERNPECRTATAIRSERGGSWVGPAHLCRSSHRRGRIPDARGRCLGFRCVGNASGLPEKQ